MTTYTISCTLSEQELRLFISMFHTKIDSIKEWAWSEKDKKEGVAEIENLAEKLNIDLTK